MARTKKSLNTLSAKEKKALKKTADNLINAVESIEIIVEGKKTLPQIKRDKINLK